MHVFNDIVIRDIAVRYNLRNTMVLQQLAIWLISNTGKLITGNSLRKIFPVGSSSSMMEYLSHFADAYLFFYVPRFSFSNKIQLVNPKKVYCIDNGLIEINSVSFSEDHGRLLENLVFLHLRRLTPEIYYFTEKKECDFVAFQHGKITGVYQVCLRLDQNNMDRELAGLTEAMDYFGLKDASIVTLDQSDRFSLDDKTINVLPFHEWATSENF